MVGSFSNAPTAKGGAVVQLRDAITLLGNFPALAGADLAVAESEIVLLEGPNGAGKSTLLRLCAGLASLHRGSGTVLGADLATRRGRREVRRRVGLLGHQTALYDDLTVEQNIQFWARANRSEGVDIEPAMERLGLADRLRTVPVSGLSAGQRRRTAMAVIVCRRPRLWLLDEPHAGLDRAGRDLIDGLIVDAAAAGATIMLSSHEIERAAGLATRVVTIAGGRVHEALGGLDAS
ncbi:MAG: heme ABC exporter ATP-binding subunit CcmA [Acidimicrobiales bacterium]